MIELRGLHLGNIARSPAESVRPDLWPDHAWVPALGPQALPPAHGAHGLFDLAGSWPAVGVRSASDPVSTDIYPTPKLVNGIWCISSNAVSNDTGAGLAANGPTGTSSPFSLSSAMTLIAVILPQNAPDDRILLEDGTAYDTNCFYLMRRADKRMVALVSGPGGYADVRTSEYIPAGEWFVSTIRWGVQTAAAGKVELFHGIDCVRAVSTSAVTTPLNAGNAPLTFFGRPAISGEILSLAPPADTALSCILAYGNRALLDSQISDLHADPLLPLRRRQPASYFVPSGSGSAETPAAMMMAL